MGEEDEPEEDYDAGDDLNDEGYQNLPGQVHDTAPSRRASHITTTPTSNDGACSEHDGAPSENDDRVGKEAILYAMISRSDQPVAKGTIISTKLTTISILEASFVKLS
ncbi:hypothetical protein EJB05_45650 [Eragrostis curvula]|uniref:Transposase Tnp1/En/Spm-like domain-containing protein n=1 Tax=Eragrostis curvula TaxID=38414 RepID=A0A5J9TL17_9POAL|nr:hypothetical protein EJB05_45650 [Eragrostis curvula]